ncbi:MAG: peroxiredoxin family protein, partial [bacterium]
AKAVPYPVTFYRYKSRLQNSIIAYRNGYRKGFITLRDSTYKIALFDDDLNGLFDEADRGAFVIDLNHDGVLDGEIDSQEYFSLSSPFVAQGLSYKVKRISPSGDQLVMTTADTVVSPQTSLSTGDSAPQFQAMDLNEKIVDLADYQDKVVLIDFWATWCKPWEKQLAELRRSYNRYHARGFEIIGMSLDYDLDYLREFIRLNKIDWPQISDGSGWDMPVVETYQLSALPRNFLLDREGTIRYKNLYGRNLSAKVFELLNEAETLN